MKKIIALLTVLCLLCAACSAMADMGTPTWDAMPAAVMEDEDTHVDEAAFQGDWMPSAAFLGTEYISPEELLNTYGYVFTPIRIADGKLMMDYQQENGEFVTLETPYVFEAGQLQSVEGSEDNFAVDLLEDGTIALAIFLPGEGDTLQCLTLFMVRPTVVE